MSELAETRWTENEWHGLRHWQCNSCPFDTLDGQGIMLEHWREAHAPKPPISHREPAQSSIVYVANKRGNEIAPPEEGE